MNREQCIKKHAKIIEFLDSCPDLIKSVSAAGMKSTYENLSYSFEKDLDFAFTDNTCYDGFTIAYKACYSNRYSILDKIWLETKYVSLEDKNLMGFLKNSYKTVREQINQIKIKNKLKEIENI
jgi:hypothetical protein